MNTDFFDAHNRHWKDAEQLFNAARWANADHLYGLAAECGLKRLMMIFGMNVDATTGSPTERKDRAHANTAWMRYESYRSGHRQGAHYALSTEHPFANWDVSQRYANQSHFDQPRALAHRTGADSVSRLMNKATLDGLL